MKQKWYENGRLNFAVGVEDTFIPSSAPGRRPIDEYAMADHYTLGPTTDMELLRESGANQIRWGIPWYKVNPEKNVWRFDWLDRMIDGFQNAGVDVIADLVHYGTPLWMDNAFLNHDYEKYVAEYAARIAERYRGRINSFTPLNEPQLTAVYCGEFGYWPPFHTGADGYVAILRAITRGMVRTQNAIRAVNPDATIVNVEASYRYVGDTDAPEYAERARLLQERKFIVEDLLLGKVDENHQLAGWLRENGFTDADFDWFCENAVIPDVMGVNYYPKVSTVEFRRGEPHTGGPQDPGPFRNDGIAGLEEVLTEFADRYHLPVYLTETSWPGDVAHRCRWLRESVRLMEELRHRGMNIVGYTWWSLFDMFYWAYQDENHPLADYRAQMGLWDLRENDHNSYDRVRTAAADVYRELASAYRDGVTEPHTSGPHASGPHVHRNHRHRLVASVSGEER